MEKASRGPKMQFEIVNVVLKKLQNSRKDIGGMVIDMDGDYM